GASNAVNAANNATANANVSFTGNTQTISLAAGSLNINAGYTTVAKAYHQASGSANTLGGAQTAAAVSNVSFAATGGLLSVTAPGGISLQGKRTDASAYKYGSGSGNILGGNVTASATQNFSLDGAGIALSLGTGALFVSVNNAHAQAYHYASGSGHS